MSSWKDESKHCSKDMFYVKSINLKQNPYFTLKKDTRENQLSKPNLLYILYKFLVDSIKCQCCKLSEGKPESLKHWHRYVCTISKMKINCTGILHQTQYVSLLSLINTT